MEEKGIKNGIWNPTEWVLVRDMDVLRERGMTGAVVSY